ncbi:glycosyl transferase family 1 [Pseudaminobacter manganicus]|uniref:Glycosyl transferase family 1 n=1 Tax=Manganibacter manganicus TaxID=1873176 RepID=A0A1V8RWM5_9HYPH|nr:glycosyl transferase family 1 [Pseudaminobacter manganicus]
MTIIHIITGLSDGGAEAVLYRLLTADRSGARHAVVSLGDTGKYGPMLQAAGVTVHALGMPKGRLTLRGLARLYRLLRRERPDVVQTWMYHANLVGGVVARLVGCRRVVWGIHHTTLVPGTTGRSTRIVDWLCARLSYWMPKAIIACANGARQVHVASGYDARKFEVVPNGYDISVFSPDAGSRTRVRREIGIPAEASVIGLVGRWDPQKDHANLIRATAILRAKHPGLHLVLVGNECDENNAALGRLLQSSGGPDKIHLLGRRADVPAVMNALDLHILSSYSEAFPNVVAEAMGCGTPCVVTDVGDAGLIVGDIGWVVPPKNSTALAEAIADALDELQDAPRWCARQYAARQRIVSEFSLDGMVSRYRQVWDAA